MVKQKVGKNGVMDRQNFWKLKHVLAPESLEIPHAIKVHRAISSLILSISMMNIVMNFNIG